MTDEDIRSIIETGYTPAANVERFKSLPPSEQFPLLVMAMREGSTAEVKEAATKLVRAICTSLCNAAPPDDLIWIADKMIELGEIVRSRNT